MMEGHPFLYQAKNRTVYRVNEEGVQAIRSRSSDEKIVAFVDGDTEGYGPDDMLNIKTVQIVMAAPPRDANRDWINQENDVSLLATNYGRRTSFSLLEEQSKLITHG